jgi:predicted nucleotidyltransferase
MDNWGLPANTITQVVAILRGYPEITSAKLFGSRAKGTHKKYSDVDIAIFAPLGSGLTPHISDELDELDTIYTFDVLDYNRTENIELKAHINRVGIELLHPTQ